MVEEAGVPREKHQPSIGKLTTLVNQDRRRVQLHMRGSSSQPRSRVDLIVVMIEEPHRAFRHRGPSITLMVIKHGRIHFLYRLKCLFIVLFYILIYFLNRLLISEYSLTTVCRNF